MSSPISVAAATAAQTAFDGMKKANTTMPAWTTDYKTWSANAGFSSSDIAKAKLWATAAN